MKRQIGRKAADRAGCVLMVSKLRRGLVSSLTLSILGQECAVRGGEFVDALMRIAINAA